MSAENDLFAACHEWRRLAEAEGEAIRTRNWTLCAACQNALQKLRESMSELLPAAQAEWLKLGGEQASQQLAYQELILELIGLTRRNQDWLQQVRETAQTKALELNQSRIQLKQLRRSYGGAPVSGGYLFS